MLIPPGVLPPCGAAYMLHQGSLTCLMPLVESPGPGSAARWHVHYVGESNDCPRFAPNCGMPLMAAMVGVFAAGKGYRVASGFQPGSSPFPGAFVCSCNTRTSNTCPIPRGSSRSFLPPLQSPQLTRPFDNPGLRSSHFHDSQTWCKQVWERENAGWGVGLLRGLNIFSSLAMCVWRASCLHAFSLFISSLA